MQEWEEELDTENMAEWWDEEDYEDYEDQVSQPTQSAWLLWLSQRNSVTCEFVRTQGNTGAPRVDVNPYYQTT